MSENKQISSASKSPLKVGVTGGIGSGKTTVCHIFEQLGIPVYYADERAKSLILQDEELVGQVKKLFGAQAYLEDGTLNRKMIAGIVFQDPEMLEKLNAIVHPAVLKDGEWWHKRQHDVPYTLKESAILFEIGSQVFYDKTIMVYAPKDVRLQRVMQRDGASMEAVEARMAMQMEDGRKMQLADFVIVNDGVRLILPQVVDIHHQLVAVFESQA